MFETGAPPGWETRSSGGDANNCLVYIRKLPCGGRIEAYSLLEAQDIHKGNFGMEGWDEHVLRQAYPPGRCLDSAALQESLLVLRSSGSWTYGRLLSVATYPVFKMEVALGHGSTKMLKSKNCKHSQDASPAA